VSTSGAVSRRCVVYVTHTSIVSGAEHALLELLRGLPDGIVAKVLCPPGELADLLRQEQLAVGHVPGTVATLRFSPLNTLRGAWQLLVSAVQVRKVVRREGATLVHANSIRAGLIAVLGSLVGGPPVTVHVHDVLPRGRVPDLVRRLLRSRASALIAVSEYSRRAFISGLPPFKRPFVVLYNPIDVDRFTPTTASRVAARRRLGTAPDGPVVGIVAQITPWKGHDTAIRALARLRRSHPTARLVCVGQAKFVSAGTRFDNIAFENELLQLTRHLRVQDAVEFWGQREDIPAILPAFDAVLVPSWEEPLGRTMLEAMASGTVVVATSVGGPPEVIEPGVTGFLAPPRDADAWADLLQRVFDDPERLAGIAAAARQSVVERFNRERYVSDVLALYQEVLAEQRQARNASRG
jgi:glycosyltransferase involved in cell wall biosynthesis